MPATAPGTAVEPSCKVVVIGAPFDANSSFLRGPALAPARIRVALQSGAMNLCVEDGRDLEARDDWRDAGDLTLGSNATAFADIERVMAGLVASGKRVLALGATTPLPTQSCARWRPPMLASRSCTSTPTPTSTTSSRAAVRPTPPHSHASWRTGWWRG